jgi:hypothetical protein
MRQKPLLVPIYSIPLPYARSTRQTPPHSLSKPTHTKTTLATIQSNILPFTPLQFNTSHLSPHLRNSSKPLTTSNSTTLPLQRPLSIPSPQLELSSPYASSFIRHNLYKDAFSHILRVRRIPHPRCVEQHPHPFILPTAPYTQDVPAILNVYILSRVSTYQGIPSRGILNATPSAPR